MRTSLLISAHDCWTTRPASTARRSAFSTHSVSVKSQVGLLSVHPFVTVFSNVVGFVALQRHETYRLFLCYTRVVCTFPRGAHNHPVFVSVSCRGNWRGSAVRTGDTEGDNHPCGRQGGQCGLEPWQEPSHPQRHGPAYHDKPPHHDDGESRGIPSHADTRVASQPLGAIG